MGRGIFFGLFWGLIVGSIVLAVASLMGEVPGSGQPEAAVVEVPAGSEFDQANEDRPVTPPVQPEAQSMPSDAPLVTAPTAPVAPTLAEDVTAPATVPQTDAGVAPLAPPPAGATDSGVALNADGSGSREPAAVIVAPELAESEAAPEADVTPAEPPAPVETATESEEPAQPEAPAPEADPNTAVVILESEPEPEPEIETQTSPGARPQASTGGFNNLAEGITVNRPTDSAQAEAEDAEPEAATIMDGPPLQAFAETGDWAGPDDRPLFSIILIDEAADASRLPALGSFQGPLAFAIPADAPGATEAMEAYRAAGHEVVLYADLPAGAQPSDIEIAMQSYLTAVPEAVAVLDGTLSGFRGDRRAAEQVTEILASTGHGLVTFSQGLGSAVQVASQAGVPVAAVLRDVDGQGQGNTEIRRALDQAVFRASQDGQAVILARMRAETITALLIWHQQDRAERVNLAPLSALLAPQ